AIRGSAVLRLAASTIFHQSGNCDDFTCLPGGCHICCTAKPSSLSSLLYMPGNPKRNGGRQNRNFAALSQYRDADRAQRPVSCTGRKGIYCDRLYVTVESPMVAGKELIVA